MKATGAIVVSAHCAFLITFTILCTIWKKLKRKPWSDLITTMICIDILLLATDLIYQLTFGFAELELIKVVLTLITRILTILVSDHGKKVSKMLIVALFCVDFIISLYDMGFEYPDLSLLHFWICSIRAVTNGSVILCVLSSCANPGFQEEKSSQKVC